MDFSIQELGPSKVDQSFAHPSDYDLFCSVRWRKLLVFFSGRICFVEVMNDIEGDFIVFKAMRLGAPTGHLEHGLGLFGCPSLLFEELGVQVCTVVAQMVAAGGKDIALTVCL
jgi:hypothetical protein